MRPRFERGRPRTRVRYSRTSFRRRKSCCRRRCASSERATTRSPDVSRSRRWTIPGRSASSPPATACARSPWTSVPLAWPRDGWTDDPGRFVDDQQVLVLEGDAQIELLRLERRRPALRDAHRDHIARRQAVALRLRRAVDLHPALGEQALGRRPRADLREAGEEAVQAFAHGLQRNLDFDFSQASSERFAPKECA